MTAGQIIAAIEGLSPEEQAKAVRFACRLDAARRLSGPELGALAQRMIDATDPRGVKALREEITRGCDGGKPSA